MEHHEALSRLGRRVAQALDAQPARRVDRAAGLARFLEHAGVERPQPHLRRVWAYVAGGLALAATAAGVMLLLARGAPLTFGAGGHPGNVGAWLAAPATQPLPLAFSDGSAVLLADAAKARVTRVSRNGAELVIERGRAEVKIVRRPRTDWRFRAGPFDVRVTGTSFAVTWDPEQERLELVLHEGGVWVAGPLLGGGRAVAAGERLVVWPGARRLEVTPSAPVSAAASAPAAASALVAASAPAGESAPAVAAVADSRQSPLAGPATPAEALAPRSAAPAAPRARQAALSFRDLAAKGRYREALETAEREGFPALCGRLDPDGLVALADTARLAGDTERAVEAWHAARRRFPGTRTAALGAFVLGRLAAEQRRNPRDAAFWFGTYLREAPDGPLAREAAGRLMEAERAAGDAAAARAAARRYLERYPGGPHAPLARQLIGE